MCVVMLYSISCPISIHKMVLFSSYSYIAASRVVVCVVVAVSRKRFIVVVEEKANIVCESCVVGSLVAHGVLPGPLLGVLDGSGLVHLPQLSHVVGQRVVGVGRRQQGLNG